jgi:hypothetical protein
MHNIIWLINRLRTMGLGEVLYRVRQAASVELARRGYCATNTFHLLNIPSRPFLALLSHNFDFSVYRAAGHWVMEGWFQIFALKKSSLGFPPQWNREPLTGITAPLTFGKTLNYRDESLVGNIKYLWEPNRHLELATLAQAYHLTKDSKYAFACRTLLQSWFEQCPYPLGPNWTSSLELAVRLLNWAFAWQLLGGADSILFKEEEGETFKTQWLTSIYQHCHFISGHFSLYSSANNHLFGEYMGLFVGSTVWSCWKQSHGWREKARAGLEEEALRQNAPDGCNREQGIWYHHEVADMMLLCGLVGRANGSDFSAGYWSRLESMLGFIASMMDVAGNVPMIGDSDDAVMVRFVPDHDFPVFKSLLATGAVLFKRGDFAAKAGQFDYKSRWLLGDDGEARFTELLRDSGQKSAGFRRAFPDGGYYILGKDFDTEREVKLIADAGPLGYLSIAAHGHADALSVVLSIGGQEFLIDPGTYAYHTERKWRDYFKGTSAHNTVRVDRLDQSVSGGNFMWLKHAKATCEKFEINNDCDVFEGVHDGYLRLKDPVTHRRTVSLEKLENRMVVRDNLDCKSGHFAEIFWHFAESCAVEIRPGRVTVRSGGVFLDMTMPESTWEPRLFRGDEDLPLGWVSRRFDCKEPVSTIVWSGGVSGPTELVTVFRYQFEQ